MPKWSGVYADLATMMAPASTEAAGGMEVDVGFEWGQFYTNPTVNDKLYSNHGGGFNVSFCDGHQQFLQSGIDRQTYIHLMTPYDRGCPANVDSTTNHTVIYCKNGSTTATDIPLLQALDELILKD